MPEPARRPKEGIEADVTRFPIVEMRIHTLFATDDIDATYDRLEEIARRGTRQTDLRDANHPLSFPPKIREHFAERETRLYEIAKHSVVADVRIVDRPLVRKLLTAFEWLVGEAPWPVRTVASEEDALGWLRSLGLEPRSE